MQCHLFCTGGLLISFVNLHPFKRYSTFWFWPFGVNDGVRLMNVSAYQRSRIRKGAKPRNTFFVRRVVRDCKKKIFKENSRRVIIFYACVEPLFNRFRRKFEHFSRSPSCQCYCFNVKGFRRRAESRLFP